MEQKRQTNAPDGRKQPSGVGENKSRKDGQNKRRESGQNKHREDDQNKRAENSQSKSREDGQNKRAENSQSKSREDGQNKRGENSQNKRRESGKNAWKITTKELAMIGVMVAVIEVSKLTLSALPNIELTTFWLILFTLFFGRRIMLVVPVFILIEGSLYGFGLWWLMYLYAWPLLVLFTWLFRRQESAWFWAVLSGAFGLSFGALCAIPYVVIGAFDGGIAAGLRAGFAWWVAGIPWDLVHCAGNFALMAVLYHPVRRIMGQIKKL